MSKIMLFINLLLSSVILAWISVAYFEYEKQSSKDSVFPSIDLTYFPISPSFTAEQIQLNASNFVNPDTKFAPKLIYLSAPPVSELSDNLLQLNLTAATSKITIENQNISLRTMDLFSPNAPLIGQGFRGNEQPLTTSSSTQFSMNIDPPIMVRFTNSDPKTLLSLKIPDRSHINTSAPVTPTAVFPNNTLTKMDLQRETVSLERPLFERIKFRKLKYHLQPPQVINWPFVEELGDSDEIQIKKYERMLSMALRSNQKPVDKQHSFHNGGVPNDRYFIVIGVFSKPTNLDRNINKILSNSLPVTVADLVPGNPSLRQLAAGPFVHKTKALEVLNSIKALGYNDAYMQRAKR